MEILWPNSFDELSENSPKELLENQARFLKKLTKDLVYAEVIESSAREFDDELEYYPFIYSFCLFGKYLTSYKYTVFTIGHDITLYPIYIHIDPDIAKETGYAIEFEIKTEVDFIEILGSILKSPKINKVVGVIMKLSKS